MLRSLRTVLADAWRLGSPYFRRSEERWSARITLIAIIALGLISVRISVVLNTWYGQFYDALQNYDVAGFTQLLLWYRWNDQGFTIGFVPLVTAAVPLSILRVYLEQFLQIRWRRWMTTQMLGDWLSNRAYYTLSVTRDVADLASDNPDQRLAEDVRDFTANTLTLGVGFINRVVSIVSFSLILWGLSGSITILGVSIPGYMLWGAVLYAIVGSWLTFLVGRPLVGLNFLQQKAEADFRFSLMRFRENTEGIALSGGETEERGVLTGRFREVALNWFRIMNRTAKLNGLTLSYAQAAVVFPFILGAPAYFAKTIALGGLMRVVSAFGHVQDSLSWFINVYTDLASWSATVNRLWTFQTAVTGARALETQGPRPFADGEGVSLADAHIHLPDGTSILEGADVVLPPGRAVTIAGASGSGKSTIFRAIAGIWPFGSGRIARPAGRYLFLPQRPYLPLGTLRHVVTYPGAVDAFPTEAVQAALAQVGLGRLAAQVDTEQAWGQMLSGGEQQRLAFARAILLRPDWLFLDEATSSLDSAAEAALYTTVREALPATTVVSIAHRPEVASFHDQALVLQREPGKPGRLQPLATISSTAAP